MSPDLTARRAARFTDMTKSYWSGRGAVLVRMLVVAAAYLGPKENEDVLAHEVALSGRMDDMPGGREAFAGEDEWKHFRALAWDAAERLVAEDEGARASRWARVLRALLQNIPEVDALAD
jgi:hypothetical protein